MDTHERQFPVMELPKTQWPEALGHIPDPPSSLFFRGTRPDLSQNFLAVVGSRQYTAYGKEVVESLIRGLRGYPITIVSGLALGIDAFAHAAALDAELPTIAVPGSGLGWNVLYPQANIALAKKILAHGGTLLSEYAEDFRATHWSFPKRNRIMAGMSHGVLLIEAGKKSGTLITARLGMEYNREVMVVPGPITSLNSFGTNRLLQDGATPIMKAEDILDTFQIPHEEKNPVPMNLNDEESALVSVLITPLPRDMIFTLAGMTPEDGNPILLSLILRGILKEANGMISRI